MNIKIGILQSFLLLMLLRLKHDISTMLNLHPRMC